MTFGILLALFAQDEVKTELGRALKVAAELPSYAYRESLEIVEEPGLGSEGFEREGRFQRDAAVFVRDGDDEVLRLKDGVVFRRGSGDWKKVSRNLRTPYDLLAGLDEKLENLKVADDTESVDGQECVIFTGEFKGDPAKGLVKGDVDGMIAGVKDLRYFGKAKIWVDDAYRVRKVQLVVTVEGRWDADGDYALTATRTASFTGFGETTVDVPEEAQRALQGK